MNREISLVINKIEWREHHKRRDKKHFDNAWF